MSEEPATAQTKQKTKAKQRYLKRKKERRKTKLASRSKNTGNDADQDEVETPPAHQEKPPKKRQRAEPGEPESPLRRSPTPELSLPQFSLPVLPDAPSKNDLALQGLDQALLDAEIVDPSTKMPLVTDDPQNIAILSSKAKKRLIDLGITELFAVQTKLLPFLLPSDPLLRGLYLPYNPPRDVCVSAPTGSGKTLAYVLPIVEVSCYAASYRF